MEIDKKSGFVIKNENLLKFCCNDTTSDHELLAKQASNLWDKTTKYLPKSFGQPKIIRLTQRKYLKNVNLDKNIQSSYLIISDSQQLEKITDFKENIKNCKNNNINSATNDTKYENTDLLTLANYDMTKLTAMPIQYITNIDIIPVSETNLCLIEYEINDPELISRQDIINYIKQENEKNIESHDEKSMEDPQGSDKENETLNSFENDKKSFENIENETSPIDTIKKDDEDEKHVDEKNEFQKQGNVCLNQKIEGKLKENIEHVDK